jgi:signal transduction histidine kinase
MRAARSDRYPAGMTATPAQVRRTFRWLGALGWLLVGVPIAVSSRLDPQRLAWWSLAFLGFGLAFWRAGGVESRARRLAWSALEVACAVGMVLALCDGLEGLLLTLVAFQLGRWAPPRWGVAWVVGQSLLASAAMAVHWTLGAALMLGPPYLGVQLLAYASAYLFERIAEGRVERARLDERLRISRDLHDLAGHRLTALRLNLQVLQRTAPPALREQVDAAQALAGDLLAEVRQVVEAFRPAPATARALHALGDHLPRPRVHVRYRDDLVIEDPQLANTVLRCVQEIVTNAARHADADNLWIDVTGGGDGVAVHARDDGHGAARVVEGNGLHGMRERLAALGGDLRVETSAGAGMIVHARIPVRPS